MDKFECAALAANLTVNKSECLHQCSGILVTSYDVKDVENSELNTIHSVLEEIINYFSKQYYYEDIKTEIKGLF